MGEIAMIVTFFFACIGILLMQVAVKRESFDFWLGCAGAGVIYLVTDWLNEVLPVTYYTGFNWSLFFVIIILYAGAKMALMKRDAL